MFYVRISASKNFKMNVINIIINGIKIVLSSIVYFGLPLLSNSTILLLQYPSATTISPLGKTATEVGWQKCSMSLPGSNLWPRTSWGTPEAEYYNLYRLFVSNIFNPPSEYVSRWYPSQNKETYIFSSLEFIKNNIFFNKLFLSKWLQNH